MGTSNPTRYPLKVGFEFEFLTKSYYGMEESLRSQGFGFHSDETYSGNKKRNLPPRLCHIGGDPSIHGMSYPRSAIEKKKIGALPKGVPKWARVHWNPYGAEVQFPPIPFDKSLEQLKEMFKWMQSTGQVTNQSCGLHVNMSFRKRGVEWHKQNINQFKLTALSNESRNLKKFGRLGSEYASLIFLLDDDLTEKDVRVAKHSLALNYWDEGKYNTKRNTLNIEDYIPDALPCTFLQALEQEFEAGSDFNNHRVFKQLDLMMNDLYHEMDAGRYLAVNCTPIQRGYVEFRVIGGWHYERKLHMVSSTVKEFGSAMLASTNDVMRQKEYMDKVKRFLYRLAYFGTSISNSRKCDADTKSHYLGSEETLNIHPSWEKLLPGIGKVWQ